MLKRKYKSGAEKRDQKKRREFQAAAADRSQSRLFFGTRTEPSSHKDSVTKTQGDTCTKSTLEIENSDLIVHVTGSVHKRTNDQESCIEDHDEARPPKTLEQNSVLLKALPSTYEQTGGNTCNTKIALDGCHENDLGCYIGKGVLIPVEKKKELLQNPWVPPRSYDFLSDAITRKFNHDWLDKYVPWMVYSKKLKGAICKFCALFPPTPGTFKGVLGAFVVCPLRKFTNMHHDCNKHVQTDHHRRALEDASAFLENLPVDIQLQSQHNKTIQENRQIMLSITSCILFCGTHDMPFRGREADGGVFLDLLNLRIDSGDCKLKNYLEKCRRNAVYTSPQIQNELITLGGEVIKENIINDVKKAPVYAVLADETADISGKEQLSIGFRFYDEEQHTIREEFVGFVELEAQNAATIAKEIDHFLMSCNLPTEDCVGFGFDGCNSMAGIDGGVQAILREKYNKAFYFHCANHKLNLVVNDVNEVSQIRNTVATVKDTIRFFRESTSRRKYAPNLSKLCETRWSEKYKSIRNFFNLFLEIVQGLEELSREGNYATRKAAYQLHCAVTNPVFFVCLVIIAKYSAILEPVVNVLQAKTIDLIATQQHIATILKLINKDREEADRITEEIMVQVQDIALKLDVEITVPRIAGKQKHRSNPPSESPNEYWRRSLIIPYLDSLSSALKFRFPDDNTPAFSLSKLHPFHFTNIDKKELHKHAELFSSFYDLKISGELDIWHNLWTKKNLADSKLKDIESINLLKETNIFFPATKKALAILCTLPCTTATVERSFSTLRRVKTWLRSTMGKERLTGLCLMSVHRKFVNENREMVEEKIIDKFSLNPRRLMLI